MFSSAPPDNADFAAVTDLHQLDGRYRNRGQGAPGDAPRWLSALLFARTSTLDHPGIDVVELRATDATTLTVRALDAQGAAVAEGTIVAERDFTFADGRLHLSHRWALLSFSPEYAPDDPLVGPRTETVELGLDQRGQGKYRSSFTGGGLVYLLFPVFIRDVSDVRFERLDAPLR